MMQPSPQLRALHRPGKERIAAGPPAASGSGWRRRACRPRFVPHTASTVLDAQPIAADGPDAAAAAADAAAGAPAAASSTPPKPAQQPATPAASFSWTKAWWPVAPLAQLDARKPYPVTMLGHSYVVWYNTPGQQWRVMEDRCPHRLAPLSEGRIEPDGTLMCSYHGWQFNGQGGCTRIPQIGDPAKAAAACASPRACVASFPTTVVDGLLYVWLEAGPQAEAEAAASPPYVMPEFAGRSELPWFMTEVPTDYEFWLEQGMDPTHANFLHHTCGFPMKDALPMPGELLPPKDVDLHNGYIWKHGNYTTKHTGLQAERQFVPPNALRVVYDRGFVAGFSTMGVPVRPGVSRVFGRFAFGGGASKPPLLFRLLGKLPHWTRMQTTLADQDTVVNAKQEAYMRSQGLTAKDYASFSRADQGVNAAHQWFKMAGYKDMWAQRMGPAAAAGDAASSSGVSGDADAADAGAAAPVGGRYDYRPFSAPSSEADYFSWYDRHTKHCAECQAGMKLVAQAANAAAVAGLLLFAIAAALAAAAKTLAAPGPLLVGALAAGCAWLRGRLLQFREEQFVNSRARWQRQGGLSLVAGHPIKL